MPIITQRRRRRSLCSTFRSILLFSILFLYQRPPSCHGATKKQQQGTQNKKKKKVPIDTTKYANICNITSSTKTSKTTVSRQYPTIKPNDRRSNAILRLLLPLSGSPSLQMVDSAQHKSLCWILFDDPAKVSPSSKQRLLERYALGVLYYTTHGINWINSDHWLTKEHECYWYGITCTRPHLPFSTSKRVTKIDLSFNDVSGLIPREMSLLKELRDVDMHGNEVQGVLPHVVLVGLKKLEVLRLHMNGIFGALPREVGKLESLRELHLYGNYMAGTLPKELGDLSNLEVLDLSKNNFNGKVPSNISKLKKLKELYLNDNDLVGQVPKVICDSLQSTLTIFATDCLGPNPEVTCDCCTVCCRGVPHLDCVEVNVEGTKKKKKEPVKDAKKKKKTTK